MHPGPTPLNGPGLGFGPGFDIAESIVGLLLLAAVVAFGILILRALRSVQRSLAEQRGDTPGDAAHGERIANPAGGSFRAPVAQTPHPGAQTTPATPHHAPAAAASQQVSRAQQQSAPATPFRASDDGAAPAPA